MSSSSDEDVPLDRSDELRWSESLRLLRFIAIGLEAGIEMGVDDADDILVNGLAQRDIKKVIVRAPIISAFDVSVADGKNVPSSLPIQCCQQGVAANSRGSWCCRRFAFGEVDCREERRREFPSIVSR